MTSPLAHTILFIRLPGFLAQAARSGRADANALCPMIVAEGRLVRDSSPLALAQGVRVGMSVVQARRLCPTLLTVALEEVEANTLSRSLWDVLADLMPVVEPDGADAGCADVMPDVYQKCGAAVYGTGLVVVTGRAERRGECLNLLVEEIEPHR